MRLENTVGPSREAGELLGGADRPADKLTAAIRAKAVRQAVAHAI